MGYYDNCVFEVHQEFFQPFDGMDVQMVSRFVQQQDIGVTEQRLCQQNFHFLTTCQFLHFHVVEFICYTQTIQQHFRVGFCSPAVQFCKFAFQFCSFDAVFICEVLFHVECIFFFSDIVQSFVTIQYAFYYFEFIKQEVVLFQNCHSFTGSDENRTFVRFQFTSQNFQECGFTGTVGTDQAITVAFCKVDINIVEKYSATVLEADTLCSDHILLSFMLSFFFLSTILCAKRTKLDYTIMYTERKSPKTLSFQRKNLFRNIETGSICTIYSLSSMEISFS